MDMLCLQIEFWVLDQEELSTEDRLIIYKKIHLMLL